jgi:hypothetical protein
MLFSQPNDSSTPTDLPFITPQVRWHIPVTDTPVEVPDWVLATPEYQNAVDSGELTEIPPRKEHEHGNGRAFAFPSGKIWISVRLPLRVEGK